MSPQPLGKENDQKLTFDKDTKRIFDQTPWLGSLLLGHLRILFSSDRPQ